VSPGVSPRRRPNGRKQRLPTDRKMSAYRSVADPECCKIKRCRGVRRAMPNNIFRSVPVRGLRFRVLATPCSRGSPRLPLDGPAAPRKAVVVRGNATGVHPRLVTSPTASRIVAQARPCHRHKPRLTLTA
jgi:hypothetical protein